jgi:hypothetical protein
VKLTDTGIRALLVKLRGHKIALSECSQRLRCRASQGGAEAPAKEVILAFAVLSAEADEDRHMVLEVRVRGLRGTHDIS